MQNNTSDVFQIQNALQKKRIIHHDHWYSAQMCAYVHLYLYTAVVKDYEPSSETSGFYLG